MANDREVIAIIDPAPGILPHEGRTLSGVARDAGPEISTRMIEGVIAPALGVLLKVKWKDGEISHRHLSLLMSDEAVELLPSVPEPGSRKRWRLSLVEVEDLLHVLAGQGYLSGLDLAHSCLILYWMAVQNGLLPTPIRLVGMEEWKKLNSAHRDEMDTIFPGSLSD